MYITELEQILETINSPEILEYEQISISDGFKILGLRNDNNEVPHKVCRINSRNIYMIKESLINGYYDPSDNTTDAEILESIESIHTVKQLRTFLKNNKTEWYRTYLGYYVEWL